jgi:hypothetical protein
MTQGRGERSTVDGRRDGTPLSLGAWSSRRAQGRSPNSEPDTFVLRDRMTFTMQLDATMAKYE